MGAIFDIIAIPLGWLLEFIYSGVHQYFLAIFLFTLLVRALLFPLSLKSQKTQADRARLAPRLERLQKKYAKDQKKLQEKQMALYEKEGVSPTGGCLPLLAQMLILFGIISVIYSPIKHLTSIPEDVVTASVTAMTGEGELNESMFKGYYKELRVLQNLEEYEADVKEEITKIADEKQAVQYYDEMIELKKDFNFFGTDLLNNPWNGGFSGISLLWLIPLLAGITSMLSSMLSMHYTKMSGQNAQQGQGCSNVMMIGMMPLFSLYITFTVPGGVGIYWICSNLIALLQTFILNQIYNPAKIRAQAELEYEERRKKKLEDKKRLAEARAREQRELAKQQNEGKAADSKKKNGTKKPKPETETAAEESAVEGSTAEESAAEEAKPADDENEKTE